MPSWTSEALKDVYVRLLAGDVEFVVIGGQAVNLWSDEVRRTALALSIWNDKPLPVMHPVLCLETKIACLFGLDQRFRQDLKHVHLSCLTFHEFIRERLQMDAIKDVLLAAERIGRLACTQNGLNLWHEQSIACESFLPIDSIRQAADTEPKLASFISLRWPVIETKIRDRRSRFLSIVEAAERARLSRDEEDNC